MSCKFTVPSLLSRRVRILFFCFYCTLLLSIGHGYATPTKVDQLSREALQQAIVEGLASGEDVSALLETWQRQPAPPSRRPMSPRSTAAAELAKQLRHFQQVLTHTAQTPLIGSSLRTLERSYEQVQAAHMLFTAAFQRVAATLAISSVPVTFEQRRHEALRHYKAALELILTPLAIPMAQLQSAPDATALAASNTYQRNLRQAARTTLSLLPTLLDEPIPPMLRTQALPVRWGALPPRSPRLEPVVTPSYQWPEPPQPRAADLEAASDAPFAAGILQQAQALDYDYVQIYEFVRYQIRTEWYAGAMKGAVGTLRQKSGNAVDQASLLIALLRVSGLPARYVHGVIRVPMAQIMTSLGVSQTTQAIRALTAAGIAHRPVIAGGHVTAVEMASTWITAYLPYANYRGTVVDTSGPLWLPLMPALEHAEGEPASHRLRTADISIEALLSRYLETQQTTDLQTQLEQVINASLRNPNADTTEAQSLDEPRLVSDPAGLLPSTLPVEVVAVTAEAAVLDDAHRQRLRIVARSDDSDQATIILDHTLPVSEVASERLTLSFLPATVEDQQVTNLYGGLDTVPAYLINLRPQLKRNGRLIAVGRYALGVGVTFQMDIHLMGPAGSEHISQALTAGTYHAIGITAQGVPPGVVSLDDPADTESLAAGLLNRVAVEYSARLTEGESAFATMLDIAVIRPWPAIAIASNAMRVDTIAGQPHHLTWQGVTLDAALRISTPIARTEWRDAESSWTRLSALQGSTLEHRVFEQLFLVDSISADKGLQVAREQGIAIHRIEARNAGAGLAGLSHPPNILEAIANWVRLGLTIDIPARPLRYQSWQGSVWRVSEPSSGAAGYFLSGGLAGGATSVDPSAWAIALLRDVLSSPHTALADPDPLSAASIVKLPMTDGQEGETGEALPDALAVLVRDETGKPVKGAMVTFTVAAGGGCLETCRVANTTQDVAVDIPTDARGLATVTLILGKKTALNPTYTLRHPEDLNVTQAAINLVDAAVTDRNGRRLSITAPFMSLAYPGAAKRLQLTNAETPKNLQNPGTAPHKPGIPIGTLFARVVDRYDNSVSNVDVAFTTPPEAPLPAGCQPAPPYVPTQFLGQQNIHQCPVPDSPVSGECGSPSYTSTTTHAGTFANLIAARGTPVGIMTISAPQQPQIAPVHFSYAIHPVCSTTEEYLIHEHLLTDPQGHSLNAAITGMSSPFPVSFTIYRGSATEGYHRAQAPGGVTAQVIGCDRASGCANPDPMRYMGEGRYASFITTRSIPGKNPVAIHVYKDKARQTVQTDRLIGVMGLRLRVDGVTAQGVPAQQPADVVALDASNRTTYRTRIDYVIEPADYQAVSVEVDLFEDNSLLGHWPGSAPSGRGHIVIPRGTPFHPHKTYAVEVVLNRGTPVEIRSQRFALPLRPKLILYASRRLYMSQTVDVVNERSCAQSSDFVFALNREARVSLVFTDEDDRQRHTILIDDKVFPPGAHRLPFYLPDVKSLIPPGTSAYTLAPGQYAFALTAVALDDGHHRDAVLGHALAEYQINRLPVGRTMVKGVDIASGNLILNTTDLQVPGRGKALEFRRVYSANNSARPGPLGVGWRHNYQSALLKDACGGILITGGMGDGSRFVETQSPSGERQWTPLKGYHATLRYETATDTFDFYSPDGTRYHYRNFGRQGYDLEFIADTNDNMTKLGYDPADTAHARLLTVEDPAGRAFIFTYDERSFALSGVPTPTPVLTKIDAPGGQSLTFDYDTSGNLIRVAREGNARVETYTYTPDRLVSVDTQSESRARLHGKLATYTNPNGHTTVYTYGDTLHKATATVIFAGVDGTRQQKTLTVPVPYTAVQTIQLPDSGTTRFAYDVLQQVTTVTNGRGFATTYTLDPNGAVIAKKNPAGTITTAWLDTDRLPASRTNARGITTTWTYDTDGNLTSESVGGVTTQFAYKRLADGTIKNRVQRRTDRNGHMTQFAYDTRGNLIEIVDAEGGVTSYTYAANGDRLSAQDSNGNVTRYDYDSYGNVVQVTAPLGSVTKSTWDVRSRLIKITDALGRVIRLDYDTLNRRIKRTNPLGQTRTWTYDPMGNTLEETDEAEHSTTFTYDGANRRTRLVDALGQEKTIAYDAQGNNVRETDFRGHVTTCVYDGADRLIRRADPLGRITTWTHDPAGNILTETDALGRQTQFAYDDLNRRIQATDALGGESKTDYDGESNVITQVDARHNATTFAYDALNRLTQRTQPLGRITTYAYDANGNRTAETDANHHTTIFEYDALNRLTTRIDALGYVTVFKYDAVGNLTHEIDARLHQTEHHYNALNRRIKSIDPAGFAVHYRYDSVGNRIEEQLPNGNIIVSEYDALNRLTQRTDALGLIARYAYDADGNRIIETDANGHATTSTYDALNQLVRQQQPDHRTRSFTYDLVGNKVAETDANGHATTFIYDALNRLIAQTDPLDATVSYTYDTVGNKLTETDSRQHTTTFTYDALNQLIQVTDALGQNLTYTYDAVGNRQSETDKRGISTTFTYDELNRPLTTVRAGVTQHTQSYDGVGNTIFETDANGHTTALSYDARNLLIKESRPLAAITEHTYDAVGNRRATRDPEGRMSTWTYDPRRRPLTQANGASDTTTFAYDSNGNRTMLTRPNGNTWTYAYNTANELTAVTNPLGATTRYTYDDNGNHTRQTDAMGNPTTFAYDACNRLIREQYADGATMAYSYDTEGNRIQKTDANGQTIRYTYDALNRPIRTDYPVPRVSTGDDRQQTTYVYDANDNLIQVRETYSGTTGTRLTTRTYDAWDQIVEMTDPNGQHLTYNYDDNGNRLTVHATGSYVTRYTYDALNRVESVTTPRGVTELAYDRTSRLTQVTYPTGTRTMQHYDAAGRIASIAHTHHGASIAAYRYTYDANGNRTAEYLTQSSGEDVTTYDYDAADRLEHVAYPDQSTSSYTYDAVANRLSERTTAGNRPTARKTYHYNSRNQITALSDELDPAASITYTYDPNGNRLSQTVRNEKTLYVYDARNRLRQLTRNGSSLGEFLYDWQGLRVQKQTPAETLRYVYDDQSVLLVTDDTGTLHSRYIYGPQRLFALDHRTQGPQYYLFDALGSVVGLCRPDGSLQARFHYDAWGNMHHTFGVSANRFGFTAHEYDTELGLLYAKARYYDPVSALFLRPDPAVGDPANPLSLHRYLYANQNPTVYVDPDGHESISTLIDQAAESCGLASCAGLALLKGLYHVATAGFATIHDPIADAHEAGQVTTDQYISYGIGGGAALALLNAGTAQIGGAAVSVATSLSGRLATAAIVGASAAAAEDAMVQGTRIATGLQEQYKPSQTGLAAGAGAIIGIGSTGASHVMTRHQAPRVTASPEPQATPTQVRQLPDASESVRASGPQAVVEKRSAPGVETKPEPHLGVVKLTGRGRILRLHREGPPHPFFDRLLGDTIAGPGDINATMIIGRIPDTAKWIGEPGHLVLNDPMWTLHVNDGWIMRGIKEGRTFQRVTKPSLASMRTVRERRLDGTVIRELTVYHRELKMLRDAGYVSQGDFMVPGPKWRPENGIYLPSFKLP